VQYKQLKAANNAMHPTATVAARLPRLVMADVMRLANERELL